MPRIPLLGGAYQARSVIAEAQRCVNLYPEKNPTDAPTQVTHYPTPGLRYLAGPVPPVPPGGFGALGVHFDGNTLATNPAIGAVDSRFLSFSYWFNAIDDQSGSWTWVINDGSGNFIRDFLSDGTDPGQILRPFVDLIDSSDTGNSLRFGANVNGGTAVWNQVCVCAAVDQDAGLRPHAIYLNDAPVLDVPHETDTGVAFTLLVNGLLFALGGDTFGDNLVADMAEFWWGLGQYVDFSVTANRRKFLSASGAPMDLGSDGSTPTGTAPTIYLSRRSGDLPAAFATNRGLGGAFTVSVGALTAAATAPHL